MTSNLFQGTLYTNQRICLSTSKPSTTKVNEILESFVAELLSFLAEVTSRGRGTKDASSTVPTLPDCTTGATSRNLKVVVVQNVGLGVVVVLGPFRDKMTSCQFHLS